MVVLIGYFNLGWVVVVVVVRVRRLVVVDALIFLSDLVVSVVRLRFEDLVFGFDTSTLLVGSSDCCSSLLLARCPSRWATSPCYNCKFTIDF